jgi:hypothetical protein
MMEIDDALTRDDEMEADVDSYIVQGTSTKKDGMLATTRH